MPRNFGRTCFACRERHSCSSAFIPALFTRRNQRHIHWNVYPHCILIHATSHNLSIYPYGSLRCCSSTTTKQHPPPRVIPARKTHASSRPDISVRGPSLALPLTVSSARSILRRRFAAVETAQALPLLLIFGSGTSRVVGVLELSVPLRVRGTLYKEKIKQV